MLEQTLLTSILKLKGFFLVRYQKGLNSQVQVLALPEGVEGAAEALVRLSDLEDVRAADEAALPPALQHQVAAVRHHLEEKKGNCLL